MNTALIIATDAEDAVVDKTRTLDEHDTIWSSVVTWLATEGVAAVTVKRYDTSDTLVQQYVVTLVA